MSVAKIIKPINDERKYEHNILDNGMSIITINDKNIATSFVSLCVGVGSLADIKVGCSGIAHFLEHMLFMGNEKYPVENYFQTELSKYAGSYNAFTAEQYTAYHFSCESMGLYNVLDIFSGFFISPLLKKDAFMREMKAVDSEFNNSKMKDITRSHYLMNTLSSKSYNNFSIGSIDTLNIPDIGDKLHEMYKYYSSDNMCLVVISPFENEETMNKIRQIFKDVPRRTCEKIPKIMPHKYDETCFYVKQESITDNDIMCIYWEIEQDINYLNYRISEFICYILGSEHKDGLCYFLKADGLLPAVYVGVEETFGLNMTQIYISIPLSHKHTDEHKQQMLDCIYTYMAMMRTKIKNKEQCIKDAYIDHHKILTQGFYFSYKQSSTDLAVSISTNYISMYMNDITHILSGYMSEGFNNKIYELCDKVMEQMTWDKMIILDRSKKHERLGNLQTDKWFGTKYIKSKIPFENKNIEYNKYNLSIVPKNEYIVDTEKLINIAKRKNTEKLEYKKILIKKGKYDYDVRIMEITKYGVPYTNVFIELFYDNNNDKYSNMPFFIQCITEQLINEMYGIRLAGWNVSVYSMYDKIVISMYCPPIIEVIDKVLTRIFCYILCKSCVDKSIFNMFKEENIRDCKNFYHKQPSNICTYGARTTFNKTAFPLVEDEEKRLNKLGLCDFDNFVMIKSIRMQIYGNSDKSFAKDLILKIHEHVKNNIDRNIKQKEKVKNDKLTKDKILTIPCNDLYNISVAVYVNIGSIYPDNKEWLYISAYKNILTSLLQEHIFTTLRTKKQLGYYVAVIDRQIGLIGSGETILEFVVQSKVSINHEHLKNTIQSYISTDAFEHLNDTEEEVYTSICESMCSMLKQPHTTLLSEASEYVEIVCLYDDIWDRKQRLIKVYEQITKEELINFYKSNVINNNKLTVIVKK